MSVRYAGLAHLLPGHGFEPSQGWPKATLEEQDTPKILCSILLYL